MERAGLINKVKIILDEFAPEGAGMPFEEYVGPLLDESARELVLVGPLYLLTPTSIPLTGGDPLVSNVRYAGDYAYIPLPSDYVRLYELKYPLWKKSVRDAISVENPGYKVEENEYLRSGYGRPSVAVVTKTFTGVLEARYLQCGKVVDPGVDALDPETALYVKTTLPEELAEAFVDSLTWRCASMVLLTMGMPDRSKMALEQSLAHRHAIIN